MWVVRWGGDRLCQTSLIPRSPDGDNNSNKKSKLYYQSSDGISSNLATSANCSVNNLHQLTAAKEGLHQTVNLFIIHIIHQVYIKSYILTKYIDV